jgi:hypothetical protein
MSIFSELQKRMLDGVPVGTVVGVEVGVGDGVGVGCFKIKGTKNFFIASVVGINVAVRVGVGLGEGLGVPDGISGLSGGIVRSRVIAGPAVTLLSS